MGHRVESHERVRALGKMGHPVGDPSWISWTYQYLSQQERPPQNVVKPTHAHEAFGGLSLCWGPSSTSGVPCSAHPGAIPVTCMDTQWETQPVTVAPTEGEVALRWATRGLLGGSVG